MTTIRTEFSQDAAGTYTIKGLEIFRSGNYGQKGQYSDEDLDSMADSYSPALCEAPATVDHKQEGPAFGWVSRVYREGKSLFCDLAHVSEALFTALKTGAYRKRSVEIIRQAAFAGGKPYLKAVSFLGALMPEVKGMRDIAFRADAGEAVVFDCLDASGKPVAFGGDPGEMFPRPAGATAGTITRERYMGDMLGHWHRAAMDAEGNGFSSAPLYYDDGYGTKVVEQNEKGFHQHIIAAGVVSAVDDGMGNSHVHSLDMGQFSDSTRKEGITAMPDNPTPSPGGAAAPSPVDPAQFAAIQTQLAAEKTAREASDKAFAEFKAETARKERLAAFKATLDQAFQEGRIAPAERANIDAFAAFLAKQEPANVVTFASTAAGASPVSLDPLVAFGQILASRPKIVDLGTKPQTDNRNVLSAPPPDRKESPAAFSQWRDAKAKEFMTEGKAKDYAEALSLADKFAAGQ